MVIQKQQTTPRLTKEQFLIKALEIIDQNATTRLRIDSLVQGMGLTKGSFYWHFKNRNDFTKSLALFWSQWSTDTVLDRANRAKGDAAKQLQIILETVIKDGAGKYDLTMRSWATQEPEIAKVIKDVDKTRFSYVRSVLEGLGFQGERLNIQTRILLCYLTGEQVFFIKNKVSQTRHIKTLFDLFSKP